MRALQIALLAVAMVLGACNACKDGGGHGGRPLVVASIFPVYDLVRRVGGEEVHVELLLAPGRSEHDYDPSPADAKRVAGAKLAFIVGLQLDDWTSKVVTASGGDTPIVALGPKVGTQRFELDVVGEDEHHEEGEHHEHHDGEGGAGDYDHHHEHDAEDPHVWLSVPRAIAMVTAIEAELAAALPDKASQFAANAEKLRTELRALDDEVRKTTSGFSKKAIVTFHGSFGYFAADYGLQIVAVIEPYPGKEPSAAYLKDVLEVLGKHPVGALYTEPQLDPRPAQVLAQEAKLPLRELDPVGGLPGRESYEELMRFNVAALAESLR
jgi:ABC-type Zn uptake system ZnuABC Zn-binding protein ZnuA